MRKVLRDTADINSPEGVNKPVTYHSWCASPLLDFQVDPCTTSSVGNGGAPMMPPRYLHLVLPNHVMRNVGGFHWRHSALTLVVESSI